MKQLHIITDYGTQKASTTISTSFTKSYSLSMLVSFPSSSGTVPDILLSSTDLINNIIVVTNSK
ncbi:hypothetical protein HanXRQr2_Chr11g0475651 [Helianthus annuus]|uniref:Uncharacterized protein n=1 Tax=Helianthus annuus TaxID=4232 RepID=A0A9K3HLR7_HELAN|nr:hypothetical protein HanXRQr2_Chr11g0475651 [Helianthus annuus]